jgi:hypothetical protein
VPNSELKEIKVSYSVGTKVNLGNFENVDVFFSETETYGVEGLPEADIAKLRNAKFAQMRERLDAEMLKARSELG